MAELQCLFLSRARCDDEPFVRRLYHDLTARGFSVWWDRECMPNRALTFLQEIRDAIGAPGNWNFSSTSGWSRAPPDRTRKNATASFWIARRPSPSRIAPGWPR
jgi:hypothetical protein